MTEVQALSADSEVRRAFYEYIRPLRRDSMFIHELSFQVDQELARIDLVAVGGALHGFEIKSDVDNLGRLARQVRVYSKVMDTVSLVTTRLHLQEATKVVPDFWGLYLYSAGKIVESRAPQPNPRLTPRTVVSLLYKDAALQLLSEHGLERGLRSKAKHLLHDHIAERIDFGFIKEAVCRQLKSHRRSM